MKVLLIGGTGTISSAITRQLATDGHTEVYLFNRGNRSDEIPENVTVIQGDINNETEAAELLKGHTFDCVAEFVAYRPEQVERDLRLFKGKTGQYIFISSASAYQTPPPSPYIHESLILRNPHWQYSRDKIACEEACIRAFRDDSFPITIVRPSHTYSERSVPFALDSPKGCWPVIQRMLDGKPVIMPGDGTSLWTVTFNEDFAKAFIGLIANPHAIGEAVHITGDEVLSWNQMAEVVAAILGVEFKPYYLPTSVIGEVEPDWNGGLTGDKMHSVIFDNSKVKRIVPGYTATILWREGVERSLNYIRQHEELQKQDPAFDAWCDALIEIYDGALAKAKQVKYQS